MEQYSTNLTDKQWQFIEKIVNTQKRRRKYSIRGIFDAILAQFKTSVFLISIIGHSDTR